MPKPELKKHDEKTDLRRPDDSAEPSPKQSRDPIEPDPMNSVLVPPDTEPASDRPDLDWAEHQELGIGLREARMRDNHRFDFLILGAGQGGISLPTILPKLASASPSLKRKHLGRSCVNFGCTST